MVPLNFIKKAYQKYHDKPSFTPGHGLQKAEYKGWLILEQNPDKNSTFAHIKKSGNEVQHIIKDGEYYGYIINEEIYLSPKLIETYLDSLMLIRQKITNLSEVNGFKTGELNGLKISYVEDENGKIAFLFFKGTRMHRGINMRLVEKLVKEEQLSVVC